MHWLKRLFKREVHLDIGDLISLKPIDRSFGYNRGTPLDRYYIDSFLKQNSKWIRGRSLEVGATDYIKRFGGTDVEAWTLNFSSNPTEFKFDQNLKSLTADLTRPESLPENSFDCFICTQTFSFIFDFQKAIAGAHRFLKPGGVLLCSVPFISQISRFDADRWGDYWRFSPHGLQRSLESHFKIESTQSFGNLAVAVAFLRGIAVEDLPSAAILESNDRDYPITVAIVARKS